MPVETVNRKPKAYFAVFSSLISATIVILMTHYMELRAIEVFEDFDEWKFV
jgi:hypothetical protein